MPDKIIVCIKCGGKFVFTEKQQREFAARGYSEPRRCWKCAKSSKKQDTGNNYRRPADAALSSLGASYLSKGYFDENGLLRREIFSDGARQAARVLSAQDTTATRLRSFLNKLQAIAYDLARSKDFLNTRVKLDAFLVAAEYARAREAVPAAFVEFVERNILLAKTDARSFNAFLEHYKSVVAYARNEKNFSAEAWLGGRGLPEGYLVGGYFTAEGHLREEVLLAWPKALVELFAAKKVTNTALRRFYNKLKALDGKMKGGVKFKEVLPSLYAFERDAAYAAARDVVPGEFVAFAARNLDLALRGEKWFKAFVEHFQCLIAFAKGRLSEGGSKR